MQSRDRTPHQVPCLLFFLLALCACTRQLPPPDPFGPCPTPQQVDWQRMEVNMFCHFGPNTFTDKEWGDGTENEQLFNPTALDCRQWAATAKQAGMSGIIITAKHHDGFCLWPNPQSSHTVRESPWRDGKGDVLSDLSQACRNAALKFGVYISPWDRNAPTYGTPAYNETFRLTLEDALSKYGDVFEQWFDGANGEGPNGKRQEYDWPLFNSTVARLQPNAVIFSDVGPGCRWVGNEEGKAGETCWSTLNITGFSPSTAKPDVGILNSGNKGGERWVPAETDVSIRPGWFWHENEHPKSVQELVEIYFTSVGRNSLLLLNVPPDRRGLIPSEDSLRLVEFRRALDSIFACDLAQRATITADNTRGGKRCKTYSTANLQNTNYHTYWAAENNTPTLTIKFNQPTDFSVIMLQEYIPLGQRVEEFTLEYMSNEGKWIPLSSATTIGYKRLIRVPKTTATKLRINITKSLAPPVLNRIAVY